MDGLLLPESCWRSVLVMLARSVSGVRLCSSVVSVLMRARDETRLLSGSGV